MRIRLLAIAVLVISSAHAATPLITLDYPRGGEVFVVGTTQRVILSSKIKPKAVKVELSRDGGTNFEMLGTIAIDKKQLPPKLVFTVAGAPSNTSVIRVSDAANPAVFVVSAPFAIATSVGAGQLVIPDGFVITPQLADGSVTNPKLASLAVTSDKVSSGQASPNFMLSADGSGGATWAAPPTVNSVPSFTGLLLGDVMGTQNATVVSQVGGISSANIVFGVNLANNAASANAANTIVKRDASGNFSAGTINANLAGDVTGNVSGNAAGFTGALNGDVTGTQSVTAVKKLQGTAVSATAPANNQILQFNAGSSQWIPADLPPAGGTVTNVSVNAPLSVTNPTTTPSISLGVVPVANGGTGSNTQNFVDLTTAQTINGVKTFGSTIGGNVSGTAGGFTGSLAGDVTGTQATTVVSTVGGVTAANVGAGANLANGATNASTANAIVKRDASGNFSAGTITANLTGNVAGNVNGNVTGTSAGFTGSLTGDVTGTQGATVVSQVGAVTAANVASGANLANSATNANTSSAIVKRDASGNFSAGTITASLSGNVSGTASGFTGSLAGDVSGTQSATVVSTVGGVTAANVGTGANLANNATNANTVNAIVKRDASGNFSAGTITANLTGSVTGNVSGTSAGFTGSLAGDITGTQGATAVSQVGGVTAANVGSGANLANNATNANTASAIVKRDASGNFSAGTITANLAGSVTGNVAGTAAGFTGTLAGDITGAQGATVVSQVGSVTAANVASGANLANNATSGNSADTIVKRDASGNFSAGTITANLTGTVTGNVTGTAANVTGVVAVDHGGTGQTTYTNGQLLIGNSTGNTLTKGTLSGTANQINVTNGTGTITLSTPQDIATTSNPAFASVMAVNSMITPVVNSTAAQLDIQLAGTRAMSLIPAAAPTTDAPGVIEGFSGNSIGTGVKGGTISGGGSSGANANIVYDDYGTIGGGFRNSVGDNAGTTADRIGATVAGGRFNAASASYSTIGGGQSNGNDSVHGVITGGLSNIAGGTYAVIGGGHSNQADGLGSVVGGGDNNVAIVNSSTVSGGVGNQALGIYATVGGGAANTASGGASFVAGGQSNTVSGDLSFGAGLRCNNTHSGTFMFSDNNSFNFSSIANNEFAARAIGGIRFVTAINGSGVPTKTFTLDNSGNAYVQGDLHVDGADTNSGTHHPGLILGGASSTETITSNRTTGVADGIGNKFGIDFYTNNTRRVSITQSGGMGIGSSPGTSVILELTSTTKALVIPRMTRTERNNNIATKVAGMVIYQTDNTPGLRVYNGTNWMRFTETVD